MSLVQLFCSLLPQNDISEVEENVAVRMEEDPSLPLQEDSLSTREAEEGRQVQDTHSGMMVKKNNFFIM